MKTTVRSDPLKELENIVGVIVIILAVLACTVLFGTVVGSGSIPGISGEVCVSTSEDAMPGFRRGEDGRTGPVDLKPGVTWLAEEVQLCDPNPDGTTRAVAVMGLTVWVVAPMIFFGLLWRELRRARREGVFADRVPAGLRRLGAVLLIWAALDLVVTALVNSALLRAMTDGSLVLASIEFPWLLVLLGIAMLALARVMGEAVRMRHDVETTI